MTNSVQYSRPGNQQGNAADQYALAYLEKQLQVTREQIEAAIRMVGNDRQQVAAYLRRMQMRGKSRMH
jgi:hypothetical protein